MLSYYYFIFLQKFYANLKKSLSIKKDTALLEQKKNPLFIPGDSFNYYLLFSRKLVVNLDPCFLKPLIFQGLFLQTLHRRELIPNVLCPFIGLYFLISCMFYFSSNSLFFTILYKFVTQS